MDSFVHRIVLLSIVMSQAMSTMTLSYPIVPYAIRRHHRSTKPLINIPSIRGGGGGGGGNAGYFPIDEYGRAHNPMPHLQQYNGLIYDGMQQAANQHSIIPNHRYSKMYPSYGIPVYKGEYSYLPARHFNPTATALDDLQEEMSHEIERGDLDGYERREFPVGRETYFEKSANDNENDYEDTDELTNRFLTNLIEYNRRLENDRNYNRDVIRYQKQFENQPDDNLDGSLNPINEFLINRPSTIDEYVDDSVQYPENYYDIYNNVQPQQQQQHYTGYEFQNEQPDEQQPENYYPNNNNYYFQQHNSEMNLNNDHQNNNNHHIKGSAIEIEKHNSDNENLHNNNDDDDAEDEDVRNLRLLALNNNNNKYHSYQNNEMKNLNNKFYTNQYNDDDDNDDRRVYKNNNNKLLEQQQQQQQYYPSNQQLSHDDNNNLYDDSNSNNNEEDSENMWSHWDKKRSSNSAINNNHNNPKISVDKIAAVKNAEEIKNTFTDRKPATPLEIKNENDRQMKLLDGQKSVEATKIPTTTTTTNRPIVKQSGVEENIKNKPLLIKGQKEIVLPRPANPLRNPFTPPVMEMLEQQQEQQQRQQQHLDDIKQDNDQFYEKRSNNYGAGDGDGPAEENVISVFDTIRKMMEMEKELKQKSEDSPKQKRFVSDEQMLIKELDNLKRTA